MVKLDPAKLKVPIRARVGKINSFYLYQPQPIIYFTGIMFEWCQCELTPVLIDDLSQIFETTDMKKWVGKEIEVFSQNGAIRARLWKGLENDCVEFS